MRSIWRHANATAGIVFCTLKAIYPISFSLITILNIPTCTYLIVTSQIEALQRGVDIIVGTPGRIVDHIERGNLQLANVSTLILDEADEMLSMGFSDQMDKIFEAVDAEKRASCDETTALQTLLFSATIPRGVKGLISKRLRADHVVVDCVGDEEERERNGTSKTGSGIRHLCIPCPYFNRAPILASIINVCFEKTGSSCHVFLT